MSVSKFDIFAQAHGDGTPAKRKANGFDMSSEVN